MNLSRLNQRQINRETLTKQNISSFSRIKKKNVLLLLARLIEKKRMRTPITKIRNEKWIITADHTFIK